MKKTVAILSSLVLVSYSLYSQSKDYEADKFAIIIFLTKHCSVYDPNPIYQKKTDEINFFAGKIFEKQYSSDDIPNLTTQALQLLYDNSIGSFSAINNPFIEFDFSRERIRRSLCYMALAFLSEEYRDYTFVADARQALSDVADNLTFMMKMTVDTMEEEYEELNSEYALMSKMFLIVNMIELYKDLNREVFIHASNFGFEQKISRYQNDLKNREKDIEDSIFIAEYNKIIADIVHTRNEKRK